MQMFARGAPQVAEEVMGVARDALGAAAPQRENYARQVEALLLELTHLAPSLEAADTLKLVLEAEGFHGLAVPGRKPCRAQALDVLSGWGLLDSVSEEDRAYWREQSEKWRDGRAPSKPRSKPATPGGALTAVLLVVLANVPAVLFAWLVPEWKGVVATAWVQGLVTLAAPFITGAGGGGRVLGRYVLWAAAILYGIFSVPMLAIYGVPGLFVAVPAILFASAAQRL